MTPQQKIQIRQWIQETCTTLGMSKIAPDLVVTHNTRLVRCLGRVRYVSRTHTYHIEFSVPLWALATDDKRRNTVIHEVCHVADHIINGFMSHKKTWKELMVLCGQLPNRTFKTLPGQKALLPGSKYEIHCPCSAHPVGKNKLSKVALDSKVYKCTRCNKICISRYTRDQIKEIFG